MLRHLVGSCNASVYTSNVCSLCTERLEEPQESGPQGSDKVFKAVAHYAYWPNLHDNVAQFVQSRP